MKNLTRYLNDIGYAELCSSFFPGTPRLTRWAAINDLISDARLHAFYRLLLINDPVELSAFSTQELALLDPLIAREILRRDRQVLQSRGFSLFMVLGNWLLFETPGTNPKIYYGDDSFGLLTRLRPVVGGTTLDLCSGPGVQSIYCAAKAARVVSVEINPLSAAVAEINRSLNGLENWDILVGDLYNALQSDAQFDHIVCNPPLLPFPDELPYPFVGHGGNDGWAVTWRVLEGLTRYLKPGGQAQIIGTTLSDGVEPVIMARLIDWAKSSQMDCQLTILSQHRMAPGYEYFEGLAFSSAAMNVGELDDIKAKLTHFLAENHTTALISTALHIQHGSGKVKVLDLFDSTHPQQGLWYV
ncbi:TPA: methyltransferase [Escherichia coli]|uniref:methyltransferase n=1 Tax=Escherichia coli TaxID=562 RepID=UPI000BE1F0D9|nr:methyltransferase [Escherichia coli]CAD5778793.1 putative methyltransferase [Escherichia coli]CAD5794099.1 putative methyltransferase [Escherichia coli]HAZ3609778.1 methyltransferase [Escherichia coli]HAZ3680165.1 methyltransferase [Escherichia coli]HBA7188863.1 methyltransferase [Escherichia coli]